MHVILQSKGWTCTEKRLRKEQKAERVNGLFGGILISEMCDQVQVINVIIVNIVIIVIIVFSNFFVQELNSMKRNANYLVLICSLMLSGLFLISV